MLSSFVSRSSPSRQVSPLQICFSLACIPSLIFSYLSLPFALAPFVSSPLSSLLCYSLLSSLSFLFLSSSLLSPLETVGQPRLSGGFFVVNLNEPSRCHLLPCSGGDGGGVEGVLGSLVNERTPGCRQVKHEWGEGGSDRLEEKASKIGGNLGVVSCLFCHHAFVLAVSHYMCKSSCAKRQGKLRITRFMCIYLRLLMVYLLTIV